MNDLASREAGPMPQHADFASTADYLAAWRLWAAIRRDAELTDAERGAAFRVAVERLDQITARRAAALL